MLPIAGSGVEPRPKLNLAHFSLKLSHPVATYSKIFSPPSGGAENAGVENAGVDSRGGKCRSGKCRRDNVWKAVRTENS